MLRFTIFLILTLSRSRGQLNELKINIDIFEEQPIGTLLVVMTSHSCLTERYSAKQLKEMRFDFIKSYHGNSDAADDDLTSKLDLTSFEGILSVSV